MIEVGFDQPEAQSGCPIALTYTHDDVLTLLDAAGFSVVSITQEHIFPYVIEKYSHSMSMSCCPGSPQCRTTCSVP